MKIAAQYFLLFTTIAAWNSFAPQATAADPANRGGISAAEYSSIQAALDANPGQIIYVPPGDHLI